MMYYIW